MSTIHTFEEAFGLKVGETFYHKGQEWLVLGDGRCALLLMGAALEAIKEDLQLH